VESEASRRRDAQANRDRLMEAAGALFAERGIDVEMKEIAEHAGMGVGTIYRNFATKEALIDALLERLGQEMVESAKTALEDPSAKASLECFLEIIWDAIDRYGALFEARMAGGKHQHLESANRAKATVLALVERTIVRGIAAGEFREGLDPAVTAQLVTSQSLSYLALRRVFPAEQVRAAMLALLLLGLSGGACVEPAPTLL
jgi:AcrR family transcriptional regulator